MLSDVLESLTYRSLAVVEFGPENSCSFRRSLDSRLRCERCKAFDQAAFSRVTSLRFSLFITWHVSNVRQSGALDEWCNFSRCCIIIFFTGEKETLDKVELISKNIRSMLITKRLEPVSTLLVTRHMQVYSTFDIRHWIFKILRSVGFVLLMRQSGSPVLQPVGSCSTTVRPPPIRLSYHNSTYSSSYCDVGVLTVLRMLIHKTTASAGLLIEADLGGPRRLGGPVNDSAIETSLRGGWHTKKRTRRRRRRKKEAPLSVPLLLLLRGTGRTKAFPDRPYLYPTDVS
ncbi:hypothetical protein F2P81_010660 [Scophthalmus maximus]|uniref:Uncharacterized protein n=1 Tax=Scophthalmus maximus TaxID=52904 RepID=A0A6A4SRH1_SCOMX|nr:hypothetical protein F2P81_010660 [Scophthalmus maximus]